MQNSVVGVNIELTQKKVKKVPLYAAIVQPPSNRHSFIPESNQFAAAGAFTQPSSLPIKCLCYF